MKSKSEPLITLHLDSAITRVDGFIGNFKTEISRGSSKEEIDHGVAILATGRSRIPAQ
jgi:heterodisulfide reductase subunit A